LYTHFGLEKIKTFYTLSAWKTRFKGICVRSYLLPLYTFKSNAVGRVFTLAHHYARRLTHQILVVTADAHLAGADAGGCPAITGLALTAGCVCVAARYTAVTDRDCKGMAHFVLIVAALLNIALFYFRHIHHWPFLLETSIDFTLLREKNE
jgi:hypothetical protein